LNICDFFNAVFTACIALREGVLALFFVLLIIWFILNGNFSIQTVIFGVIASALVTLFSCFFLNYRPFGLRSIKKLGRYILYIFYVIEQIFLSCIAVCCLVYSGKEPRPMLITFRPDLKTDLSRVFLANSITLTPGTITANVKDGVFAVHALDRDFGAGIEKCKFIKKLQALEEDGKK